MAAQLNETHWETLRKEDEEALSGVGETWKGIKRIRSEGDYFFAQWGGRILRVDFFILHIINRKRVTDP